MTAAILWGSGFVAQRAISGHLGPLAFNAVRNLIALAGVVALLLARGSRRRDLAPPPLRLALFAAMATGMPLFLGGWIQQAGIARTTAGNAGFVTGLYVVLVPLFAAMGGARLPGVVWPAAGLSAAGMYLLCSNGAWVLGVGDALVLVSAGFWALHVLAIGRYSRRIDGLWLTGLQLAWATVATVPLALCTEGISSQAIRSVGWPLLYSGLICGAFAFSLQIAGQRHAPAAHAAVLMSLEAVFAAVFGWLLLGERLGLRGFIGAGLMLVGILVSQWPALRGSGGSAESHGTAGSPG